MPWIRLDDQIGNHPKFVTAGPVAAWLWVCGQSYCNRYLTDGFIVKAALPTLGVVSPEEPAAALVAVGLWEETADGYRVHDYHEYQPTKAAVIERREERRESGRRGGIRGAATRWGDKQDDKLRDEQQLTKELTRELRTPDKLTDNPVPDPVPVASKEATRARDRTPASAAFQALWNSTTIPPLPRCRELTDGRRKKIAARLGERPLEEWGPVMARVNGSAFCRGQNDRGWKASFDWLIENADNAVKVLEGKYDDRDRTVPRLVPSVCRHRHDPPCANDAVCTRRYLDEQRGAPPAVAS